MSDYDTICMFCGEPYGSRDTAFTTIQTERGRAGWHPEHWPEAAKDMGDLILRQTAFGIRGRVKWQP